ncbi:sulfatase-like hydrolase/transferase [Niabella yanshanensis]|uniref:Sulfatase-like hydrolase/transferase n=1 Tax=Niabella yanshanensis TaxID=577386 RepID=A0ABZ0WBR4_9BACT|nr:alkaline phosphatase family protein [Niabella yanshanensis]WQD39957.1 sulfatase-like hydrolase/transferase [Niabella yanshanensis]
MFPHLGWEDWFNILKGGGKFDIAALFYFGGLPLVMMLLPVPEKWRNNKMYLKIVRLVFFIFIGIALLLNCIDFIYYRFTLRRTTFSVLQEFQNEKNGLKLVWDFIFDFWYVVLIFAGLILSMIWLYNRVQARFNSSSSKLRYYITGTGILVLTVVLAIGGIRGDFKHSTRPITISNAGDYVKSPNEIYLVLNTPFTFIRTMSVKGLKKMEYYKEYALEAIYTPVHTPDPANHFQKKNVVLILLESFGKEAVGFYNKDLDNGTYKGYTPFLDSLAGQSKVFWNSFANGRKSIDAIPSCIASIPSGFNPFVLTPYVSDTIGGLAHALKNEGYHTSFFHGAPNGSMGFAAIIKLLGIAHYYGKNEFNNDKEYDGIWGIWDEPFFQFFDEKLSSFQQPFFSTIFSVSSHHPFKVPKQYEGVFEKGALPVFECISYTDMALRKFFNRAKTQPWFNNTLFIISADHATETHHREYQNAWGEYAIPILLYAPGDDNMKGVTNEIIQQIDIMPTVLGYLNYNKPFLAYGNNVLDSTQQDPHFAYQYSGGYRWFQGDYLLMSDALKPGKLYNWKIDRFLQADLAQQKPDTLARMNKRLKAFIQQYNNRLIDNRLTVR